MACSQKYRLTLDEDEAPVSTVVRFRHRCCCVSIDNAVLPSGMAIIYSCIFVPQIAK